MGDIDTITRFAERIREGIQTVSGNPFVVAEHLAAHTDGFRVTFKVPTPNHQWTATITFSRFDSIWRAFSDSNWVRQYDYNLSAVDVEATCDELWNLIQERVNGRQVPKPQDMVDLDKATVTGFYEANCKHFKAEYNKGAAFKACPKCERDVGWKLLKAAAT